MTTEKELEKYFKNIEEIKDNEEFDVLEFWKLHQFKYQRLPKMAKYYLSIPATSMNVESLFSRAGQIIPERRAKLSTEFSENLVLLEEYFAYEKKITYEKTEREELGK